MKLTKQQLRQIIREEVEDTLSEASPQSELGLPHKFTSEVMIAVFEKQLNTLDHKIRSDEDYIRKVANAITEKMRKEPDKAWSFKLKTLREKIEEYTRRGQKRVAAAQGRQGGREQHAMAVAAERGFKENTMKLTKTQLKQIIKEELNKVLNENDGWNGPGWYTLEGGKYYGGPFGSEEDAEESIPLELQDELSVEKWSRDPDEPMPAPTPNISAEKIAAQRALAAKFGLEERKTNK